MTNNDNTRDIIHELAATMACLGDDYTLTCVECDPGDSAARIIKRNSEKTMYVTTYSDPDDTEITLYDERDNLTAQHSFYNGAFSKLSPEEVAEYIRKSL